jgi:outer membrane immunogenic protein
MRRSTLISILAAGWCLGLSGAALAADMPLKAPPPPPLYVWTGWYGGVNVGYSWGHSTATDNTALTPTFGVFAETIRHDGWEASVEGGYCWQQSPSSTFVGCLEVRYDFPRERSGSNALAVPLATLFNNANVDPLLIGPHLGVLTDANRTMWYLAGGLAVGQVGGSSMATGTGGTSTANPSSVWSAGWFIGAGAEHMLDRNWGVKVEYDYVSLASSGATAPYVGTNYLALTGSGTTATLGGHAVDNTVTVGINYHLH